MVNWQKAKCLIFGAIFLVLPFLVLPAKSAFNPQINYQGKLMDSVGNPAEDGQYKMIFKLYDVPSGGTALWTEDRSNSNNVTATSGLFSVMLGEVNSFPSDFNFNQTLYLQVEIGTSTPEVLLPRKKLGAVPAAFYASTSTYSDNSGQLQGQTWASPGAIGTGTASTAIFTNATSTGILRVIGNSLLGAIASGTWQGDIIAPLYGGTGQNSSGWTGIVKVTAGVWGTSTISASDIGGFTAGSIIFASSTGVLTQDNSNFFWNDSNNRLGIGTSTPSTKLTIDSTVGPDSYDGLSLAGGGYGTAFLGHYNLGAGGHYGYLALFTSTSPTLYPSVFLNTWTKSTIEKGLYVGTSSYSGSALFAVGASQQFQVNSSGDITKIKNLTYSWPDNHGSGGYTFLRDNGSGTLEWVSTSSFGFIDTDTTTSPAGFDGSIQFNDNGVFQWDNDFRWISSTQRLSIGAFDSPYYRVEIDTKQTEGNSDGVMVTADAYATAFLGNRRFSGGEYIGKAEFYRYQEVDEDIFNELRTLISASTSYFVGGNVGIGVSTTIPSLLSVGSNSGFQVDSSGDLIKIKNLTYSWPDNHGSGGYTFLRDSGSGTLEWVSTSSFGFIDTDTTYTAGAGLYLSGTQFNIYASTTDFSTTSNYLDLKTTGVTAGNYGSATQVGQFTVDAKGRITSATNVAITGVSPSSSALTSTYIWVGNASNLASPVAMSGDATLSNTGVLTIANNAITSAKIDNNTIEPIDLATSTPSPGGLSLLSYNGSTFVWTASTTFASSTHTHDASQITSGVLSIARGGTGTSTAPLLGQLLMGNSGGGYDLVATSSLGLGNVTGSGSSGHVSYWNGANSQTYDSDGNFYWDATNNRLGIGTTTPGYTLTVVGTSSLRDVIPSTNLTYNLGASDNRWKSVWAEVINIGASTWSLATSSNGRLGIFDAASGGGTERMTIATNGNVGIGSTTPNALFSVGDKVSIESSSVKTRFHTGGIDIASGCFSVDGTCLESVTTTNNLLIYSGIHDDYFFTTILGVTVYAFPTTTYEFDPNGWRTASSTITVPAGKGGTYIIGYSLSNEGGDPLGVLRLGVRINEKSYYFGNDDISGANEALSGTMIVNLSGGDIVRLEGKSSGPYDDTVDTFRFWIMSTKVSTVAVEGDSLDFFHFVNAMTLDADTSINLSGRNLSFVGSSASSYLTSNGFWGIGTSTPGSILSIASSTGNVIVNLTTPTNGQGVIYFSDNVEGRGQIKYDHSIDAMSFFTAQGARMTINSSGNVGIGTTSPSYKLSVAGDFHVTGTIRVGNTASAGTAGQLLMSNGTSAPSWISTSSLGITSAGGWTDDGTVVRLTTASDKVGIGTASPSSSLHIVDGALLVTGTTGATPISGAGTRLMWIPEKSAFRAGVVNSSQWDSANIGDSSVAFGSGTYATGSWSNAFGRGTTAGNNYATAFGWNSTARGEVAFASGYIVHASGNYSVAFGGGNTASGNYSAVFNQSNTASGAHSTAFGNYATASGPTTFAFGYRSIADGEWGAVSLGYNVTSSGITSFALGREMTVSGNYSFGINVSSTAPATLSQANTIALMGGNVGVGTTTPSSILTVNTPGNNGILLTGATTGYVLGGLMSGSGNDTGGLVLYSGGDLTPGVWLAGSTTTKNYIMGSVGIGTTTPAAKLHVNVTENNDGIFLDGNNNQVAKIYYDGSSGHIGNFALLAATSQNVFITASGPSYFNGGNVGIGTTTPAGKLHVLSAVDDGILLSGIDNKIGVKIYHTDGGGATAGRLLLYNNTVENIFLNADGSSHLKGDLGIGTTTPDTKLHISGTTTAQDIIPEGPYTGNLSAYNLGASTTRWNSVWANYVNVGSSTWSLSVDGYNRLKFNTEANGGGKAILSVLSSDAGRVGIGTADPITKLSIIASNDDGITLLDASTTTVVIAQNNSNGVILLYPNSTTESVRLFSAGHSYFNGGNLGIGTTTPSYKLSVAGDFHVTGTIRLGDSASSGDAGQLLMSNGASAPFWVSTSSLNITSAGGWTDDGSVVRLTTIGDNVGIGTTTASAKLHVNITTGDGIILSAGTSGGAVAKLFADGDNGHIGNLSLFQSTDQNVLLSADGVSYLNGGNLGIGTASPAASLDIVTTANSQGINVKNSSNSNNNIFQLWVDSGNDGRLDMFSSGTQKIKFDTNGASYFNGGNLGIGTTTPNSKLTVTVNSPGDGFGVTNNSGLPLVGGGASSADLNAGALAVYYNGSLTSYLQATGTTMLQVTSRFRVNDRGNLTRINDLAYSWPSVHGLSGTLMTQDGLGNLSWISTSSLNITSAGGWTDDGTVVRLTTLGDKVGINTVIAVAPLHIGDSDNDGSFVAGGQFGSGYSLNLNQGQSYFVWSSKRAAVRAGVPGTDLAWDDAYVGNYSVAMGYETGATGTASIALGAYNVATANYATALGINMTVSGESSFGINVSSTAPVTISQANTIALMGGNVGVNKNNPERTLDVNGVARVQGYAALSNKKNDSDYNYSLIGNNLYLDTILGFPMPRYLNTDSKGYAGINMSALGFNFYADVSSTVKDDYLMDASLAMDLYNDGQLIAYGEYNSGNDLDVSGAGTRMIWYPKKAAFRAGWVEGTQWDNANIGINSTAFGLNNVATGQSSFAFNQSNTSSGNKSLAGGFSSFAEGNYSVAIGQNTWAKGLNSVAFGRDTYARGINSTVFGYGSEGQGDYSTALGIGAIAGGNWSTAFGSSTLASGNFSTAFGADNVASGFMATVFGYSNEAIGDYSTAFGYDNIATGTYATAFGYQNQTNAASAVAIGYRSQANGEKSMAFGDSVIASGIGSKAFGTNIIVSGQNSIGLSVGGTASTLSQNNTFALMGGNVGIGTIYPSSTLHVDGGGLLVTGTTGGTPVSGAGTRLMWIPAKGAFRAGAVQGTQWDNANVGDHSVAFGLNNIASHPYSAAFGWLNRASNQAATVFGIQSTSSGYGATAFGKNMDVSGSYSYGINLASNNPATLSQDYTMAVMGGNVGINTTTPGYKLTIAGDLAVTGTIRVGNSLDAGTAGYVLSSNGPSSAPSWINTSNFSSAAGWTRNSPNIYTTTLTDNVGIGTSTPASKLHVYDGGLLVTGTTGGTPVSGAGTRLMWIPATRAFRMGAVTDARWDNANIGDYSFAGGYNTNAKGSYSFAYGSVNTTDGFAAVALGSALHSYGAYSVTFGYSNTARGDSSIAFGTSNSASGTTAVAFGSTNKATANYSVAFGYANTSSNSYAVSFGDRNIASGLRSIAFGQQNTASAGNGIAMGINSTAGSGGAGPIAIGSSNTSNGDASIAMGTSMSVSGNYSFGVNVSTTAASLSQANTIAFMGGNVGIGTTTPLFGLLEVSPVLGNAATGITLLSPGGTTARSWIGSNDQWHLTRGATASNGITIHSNGNVGISSSTPSDKLIVDGTVRITNIGTTTPGSSYVCVNPATGLLRAKSTPCDTSDEELKINEKSISEELNVLDALKQLRGIYFNWDLTNPYNSGMPASRQIGVIAQEVSPVLPEIVSYNESEYDGQSGYYSVDYPKLTAFLIEVAKAQQNILDPITDSIFINTTTLSIAFGSSSAPYDLTTYGNLSFILPADSTSTHKISFSNTATFDSSISSTPDSRAFIFNALNFDTTSTDKYILSLRSNNNPTFSVSANGDVHALGNMYAASAILGTSTNPGDLAERVDTNPNETVEAGDVMMVDPASPDRYQLSNQAYEPTIAGVISTNPTIIVGNGKTDQTAPLAMFGRVPVKYSEENGPIQRGDLLVSAGTPGRAMKYDPTLDNSRKVVGIIGIALDNSAESTNGKVMALIRTGWVYNKTQAVSNLEQQVYYVASSAGVDLSVDPELMNVETDSSGTTITYNSNTDLNLNNYAIINVKSINTINNNKWTIDENGLLTAKVTTSEGDKNLYGMVSESIEITLSGSDQLINGEAIITFPTSTQEMIDEGEVMKVSVTLTSIEAKGVAVISKSAQGFTVKELDNGASNATFDWIVIAKRRAIINESSSESEIIDTGTSSGDTADENSVDEGLIQVGEEGTTTGESSSPTGDSGESTEQTISEGETIVEQPVSEPPPAEEPASEPVSEPATETPEG